MTSQHRKHTQKQESNSNAHNASTSLASSFLLVQYCVYIPCDYLYILLNEVIFFKITIIYLASLYVCPLKMACRHGDMEASIDQCE